VLINGCLTETIHHQRGTRQGDPLPQLLCDIVMDTLAKTVDDANRLGALTKLAGNQWLNAYCYMLYADDVVLFASPDENEIAGFDLFVDGERKAMPGLLRVAPALR
jgi:hypothetical protein